MFERRQTRNSFVSAVAIAELMFHYTVRSIRTTHRNAFVAIAINLLQVAIMMLVFTLLMTMLGMRSAPLRGDFFLFLLSGIFLYMTHIRTFRSVTGAAGATSGLMNHAPMTTAVSITSAALSVLYIQVLSIIIALTAYHALWKPVSFVEPVAAFAMLLLAWLSGLAIGLIFKSISPWFPEAMGPLTRLYIRANMIFSGKMFLANTLPSYMLVMFDWNPLFHAIDQSRGFIFNNYFPHKTSIEYPLYLSLGLLMLGLMGEFYTRNKVSISWNAKR